MNDYVKERDEMLEKRSVEELITFIKKSVKKGWINRYFYNRFLMSSDLVKKATLCKMICGATNVSKDTKKWAKEWLKENNMSEEII